MILDTRDVTPEERAAIAEEPRTGVWCEEPGWFGALRKGGDGRPLSQHQTNCLILGNVRGGLDLPGQAELLRIAGDSGPWIFLDDGSRAFEQRGGIHSDPLVRLLAYRAWGDRDRAWRKRDTARALIATLRMGGEYEDIARRIYGWDGVSDWHPEYTAQRGDRQATALFVDRENDGIEPWLDLFDELDAKLAAGGDPLPSGPFVFEVGPRPQ